jgi:2-polyprenyl-6-hydroxyphenyl methylase/3-demethylubiquinone-9 3-methyltransferase
MRGLQALVKPRMKWFGRVAGAWMGRRVLDLGCGGGFMAEAMAERGANVIGVDPAVSVLVAARDHAIHDGLHIRYKVGRGESIPMDDRSVDRVVCVDVLEHVDDLALCCREIARVLKPGGLLLFDTINRTWLSRLVVIGLYEQLLKFAPHGTHDFSKLIRPRELRRHLAAAGLACGRMVGLGPIGFNWRGDPVFARLPTLAVGYMGTARRLS